ncbi:hypothetical protein L2E82_53081 [Cichorium intybus]|nr:hypothetical protein L2E82_53081 [Cichorium intybus]
MGIVLHGGPHDSSVARAWPTTRAFGGRGPYCWSAKQAAGTRVASSPDSDLEAFSHNPAHGSFAPLAFQPSAMTNCANQRSRSYWWVNNPTLGEFWLHNDRKSRHRRIKKQRRYERLAATSQLSLLYDRAWEALGPPDFQGRRGRTGHRATCGALPAAGPYLRLSRFQGGQAVKQKDKLFPRPPPTSSGLPNVAVSAQFGTVTRLPVHPASPVLLTKNGPLGALDSVARLNEAAVPSYLFKSDERFARQYRCGPPPEFPLASPPLRHSSPSFGSRQACSHSNPSQKIKVRSAVHPARGDPANQLPCALRVYSPVDSHTCQTPWSVFQDGPNGVPTGRCREHAGSGHDGALTLSGAPFQGTWARSAAEDASPDYNSDSEAARFSSWADPGSLAVTKGILVHVHGSFCFAGFDNDPSAGSPTETLLRLLLPLNDKVQWNSRDVAGGEPPTSPRS